MSQTAARVAIIIAAATTGGALGYWIAWRPMAAHCVDLARTQPGVQCTYPADAFVVVTPIGALLGAAIGILAVHLFTQRSRPAV